MQVRITPAVGALVVAGALSGVLVSSTYDAAASRTPATIGHARPAHHAVRDTGFVAPMPHRYGSNGMRMGLHCETVDPS
jgi:hypothetical protein